MIAKQLSKHLFFWYNQANNKILEIKNFWEFLRLESEKRNINPNLILGIIGIEMSNRNVIYYLIEHILALVTPGYLSRRDASIGIAQLKVSTIKNELEITMPSKNIRQLMNKKTSIRLLTMLISKYCGQINFDTKLIQSNEFNKKLFQIICKYTTGSYSYRINPWLRFYYITLKSLIKKEWISYEKKAI